jgi:CBS domain containing-hemolysin-like protein
VLSAVFSGLETGIYRLSRLRLRLGAEKGYLRYRLLGRAMHDGSGLLLSLLVANNLANYLATSSVTYLFLAVASSERAAELFATILTAPLLFVFAESMPKNIFLYQADAVTPYFGPFLYLTHRALTWCGVVPLLKLTSHLFGRMIGSAIPSRTMITSAQSHQVRAILRDTREEGILSQTQAEIVDRIVNVPNLRLAGVMVPLHQVQSAHVQCDRTMLLNKLKKHALTRLLVWEGRAINIVGFINVYDVLASSESFDNLEEFLQPIRRLDAATPVIDAIDIMRTDDLKIVLVMRSRPGGRQTPVGIVTMKDLVEELLGELAEW